MTSIKTPASDSPPLEVTSLYHRRLKKLVRIIARRLSDSDKISYQALNRTFWDFTTDEDYRVRLEEAFASPLYSDNCKRYFAATNIDIDFILRAGDMFLTEELILGQIRKSSNMGQAHTEAYFKALMESSHLSERILLAVITSKGRNGTRKSLDFIPDAMITPQIISSWQASGGDEKPSSEVVTSLAANRVRQAYPEYDGFPDEWVLKVFCGG